MPDDLNEKAEASRNRPNTIDLRATEIPPEPASGAASPGPEANAGAEEPAQGRPRAFSESARGPRAWQAVAAVVAALALFAAGLFAGHWYSLSQGAPAASQMAAQPDAALLERISKLEAAANAPRGSDPQLLARIAAAEAAVKTASEFMAARDRRSDEAFAVAQEARERAAKANTAADEAIKTARANAAAPTDLAPLLNRLAALENTVKANDTAIKNNREELGRQNAARADDMVARLATAAVALRHAVERGAPFAAELNAAKALGADPNAVKPLEPFATGGIPSAQGLARELMQVMPAVWRAGPAQASGETFFAKLQANAEKIVRVRPSGERSGDEPADVKARIEARAQSADLPGVLSDFAKLPPEARAPAEAWVKRAQDREAALAAARSLAQNALSALAKSGS